MSSRKIAIAAGVVCGCAATAWIASHWRATDVSDVPGSQAVRTLPPTPSGVSRWMPWNFSLSTPWGGPALPVDLYTGRRETVEIHVVDGEGRGVSGAEVQVLSSKADYGAAGLDGEQYDEWLSLQEDGEEMDDPDGTVGRDVVERGRTDRKGVWLAQLKPGVDVTFVAHDGSREGAHAERYSTEIPYEDEEAYEGEEEEAEPEEEGDTSGSAIVTIELAEIAVLRGQVSDEYGRPVANATLDLFPLSDGDIETHHLIASTSRAEDPFVTGDDGRFRIPLRMFGAFDLSVHADKMRAMTEPAIQILPGRETEVNLTMITAAELAGVLRDADGNPVGGATIHTYAEFESDEESTSGTTSLESGVFQLTGLEQGKHTLMVNAHGSYRPMEIYGVESGGAALDLRLVSGSTIHVELDVSQELRRWMPASYAAVPNEDQRASSGPRLQVMLSVAGTEEIPMAVAIGNPPTNRRTRFGTFGPVPRSFSAIQLDDQGHGSIDLQGLPPATYRVTIVAGQYISELGSVYVGPGSVTPVLMRLPDPNGASISGVIQTDDRHQVIASASLQLSTKGGVALASTFAGPGGEFRFASVPAGEYLLLASVYGIDGQNFSSTIEPQPVVVRAGGSLRISLTAKTSVPPDLGVQGGLGASLNMSGLPLREISASHHGGDGDEGYEGEVYEGGEDGGEDSGEDGDEDAEEEDGSYTPDVTIDPTDSGLIVLRAPGGPTGRRLFGGDRVVSIDGQNVLAMDGWEALELLSGVKNTTCRLVVDRPATRQTVSVDLARTRPYDEANSIYY